MPEILENGELELHAAWYPWCQRCRTDGWTVPSAILTPAGTYVCLDCADDELALEAALSA